MKNTELTIAIATVVQAVASLILVGVTVVYVWLTHKLAHLPYVVFLKPQGVDHTSQADKWLVRVRNISRGYASDVHVWIVDNEQRLLLGASVRDIEPGVESEFYFPSTVLDPTAPIVIEARTLAGQVWVSGWNDRVGRMVPFRSKRHWKKKIQEFRKVQGEGSKRTDRKEE